MGQKKQRKPRRKGRDDDSDDEGEFELVPETDPSAMKYSFPSTDTTSDVEPDMRRLVTAQNKKKKKSGGFQSMGLSHGIFKGVMKKGYKVPTPIQRKCIPIIMDGKDVVAMARTGSGKTAAFLIPMFEKLRAHSTSGARALILSPTRELALQTMKFTKELGRFTGLRAALILGGDSMEDQFAALHENPDIIIGTPGRLLHVLVEMEQKLMTVEYIVFDEADRLFEMGFADQLQEIIGRLPEARQTLLFSATLPKLLVQFAQAGLNDPTLIRLDVDTKISEQLKMSFLAMRDADKPAVLLHLLRTVVKPEEQTVVFLATKHHVEFVKELLTEAGLTCSAVYSSLDQTARKINIAKFTNKKTKVMLVTDIAARGIDIPMLDNVINYNFPCKPKLFVHRVGRVARAGRSGTAYSLVAPDETPLMLDLHLFLGRALKVAGKDKSTQDWDGLYSKVPQSIIDDEDANIRVYFENNLELGNLKRVSERGYSAYLKSRSAPSHESVKRMKGMDTAHMGFHPLLVADRSEVEDKLAEFVDGVRNYKPNSTIFEISASNKNPAFSVMKSKRSVHQGVIRRLQDQRSSKQEVGGAAKHAVTTEMTSEQDIEDTFSTVVAPGHKRKHAEDGENATKKKKENFRDEEHFLPYRPQDHHSEKGLGLESSFQVQASDAMLDLGADEAEKAKQQKNQLKWDRKKKKFVREGIDLKKKKIKTESGTWVSASFKTDSYKRWLQQSKMKEQENEEEEQSTGQKWGTGKRQWKGKKRGKDRTAGGDKSPGQKFPSKFGGKRKDGPPPRNQGGRRRPRSELKSTDQILKNRIKKEKEQAFQGARRAIKQKRRAIAGDKRH
ncbi:DDX54 [Branchiostoma lanceolatum]|uniref:ATP-dependent RNA helicase DDX54 n=1 Tax=Branchiostoma lanceolatum TaxID=7740 RepID=A0A8J9Z4I3_BRALA|nr:DDX54 [Branchiostoma lanceolatum]